MSNKEGKLTGRRMSLRTAREVFLRHLRFVGPGLVASVAYIDPGNWATDLQAGAEYGYKLLFVVLVAGLAAVVLQLLAVRIGAVTSTSLATQIRLLFLRWEKQYPKYRRYFRFGLYFVYSLSEIAIVATDLAELLGSAIALNLLFPKLPLFAGVLVTASDVLLVLLFFRSDSGRKGMLFFEIVIVALVLCVFVCFMILLHLVKPDWGEVFFGMVPSKTLVKPGALYVGVGIIGATVMPHALFLGSSLASVDRLSMLPMLPNPTASRSYKLPSLFKRHASQAQDVELASPSLPSRSQGTSRKIENNAKEVQCDAVARKLYEEEIKRFDRISWVDLHLLHSGIDTAMSLLCFALTINSAILTLAGAAFYYNADDGNGAPDLKGAHDLIASYLGSGAAIIFALALLCAGQSASITCTLAGQVVSEGFLEWKTSPIIRRALTRLIGVIPAAIVAAAVGYRGIDTMLVASQVLLSIVLPTVILPLVYLCSQEGVMTVEGPQEESSSPVPSVCAPPPSPVYNLSPISPASPLAKIIGLPAVAARHELRASSSRLSLTLSRAASIDSVASDTQSEKLDDCQNQQPALPSATVPDLPALQVRPTRRKSYVSSKWVTWLGYLLFAVVIVANSYVIVELGLGQGG